MPRVRIYVTGSNEWRSYNEFPLRNATPLRLYFSSRGKAQTLQGNGVLAKGGGRNEIADQYVFDPKDPVPVSWVGYGADRREVQSRADVLVYTTEPLEKKLEAIGDVFVELYAASDARDTDFTAVVSDVQPDGRALQLGPRLVGIVRARYREGMSRPPSLLTPGKIEGYTIQIGTLAHAFLPGHRIRVEISSSAYPMFNPNQNTGNPIATDTQWQTATQRIFHDAEHPSALVLPVVADSNP